MDIRYIINAIAAEEENVAYRFFWGVGGGGEESVFGIRFVSYDLYFAVQNMAIFSSQ